MGTRGKFPKSFRDEQRALSDPIIKDVQAKFRDRQTNFFNKRYFRNEAPYSADPFPFLAHTLCGDDLPTKRCRDEKLAEIVAYYRSIGFAPLNKRDGMLAQLISAKHPTWVVVLYRYPDENLGLELSHHIYATELDRFQALRHGKSNAYAAALQANVGAIVKKLSPRRKK